MGHKAVYFFLCTIQFSEMNSNKAYANLLFGFIMLFLIAVFLGYQYFIIYEFSDVHQLIIYYRRQQRRQRSKMKKQAEKIQILPDSSQEEKIRLKEEYSEVNIAIFREEKDKQHKPEKQQLPHKKKQNSSDDELLKVAQPPTQNPQILQENSCLFSESEQQKEQDSDDFRLPTSKNASGLVPDMQKFAQIAKQQKIQLTSKAPSVHDSQNISLYDDVDELSQSDLNKQKFQMLNQYKTTKPKNQNIMKNQKTIELKASGNINLEHQKSITDEISSFHSQDLKSDLSNQRQQQLGTKKQDISSIQSKKIENCSLHSKDSGKVEEMKKIEVSSIHSKQVEEASIRTHGSQHSIIDMKLPLKKNTALKEDSESIKSKERVRFDSQRLDDELIGSESEFSKQQQEHSIISKTSNSQQGNHSSVYIQPKSLKHAKKSQSNSKDNSRISKEQQSSSSQQDSKDSGGLQKLMNKLSYIPAKGGQIKKDDNSSSNKSGPKSSINQVYSSSFTGTHKTILEKFGFLQNSNETKNQSNSSDNYSEFSKIQDEKKPDEKGSNGGLVCYEDIIPIIQEQKKLPDSSEEKVSSQNQSNQSRSRSRRHNRSRRSGSSKASQRSKGSSSLSNKISRSSQPRSGSSKTVPSKSVNLSFIKKEKKKLKRYRLLFHDFRHEHFLQTYYLPIDFMRFLLYVIIISVFYKTGKSMTIIILIINLIYLCYIIAILPFKHGYVLAEAIVIEGIANISLLLTTLYYFIANNSYDIQTKLNFGWIIIICNLFLVTAISVCCVIEIIKAICEAIKEPKSEPSSRQESDFGYQTILIENSRSNSSRNQKKSVQNSKNVASNSNASNNSSGRNEIQNKKYPHQIKISNEIQPQINHSNN